MNRSLCRCQDYVCFIRREAEISARELNMKNLENKLYEKKQEYEALHKDFHSRLQSFFPSSSLEASTLIHNHQNQNAAVFTAK